MPPTRSGSDMSSAVPLLPRSETKQTKAPVWEREGSADDVRPLGENCEKDRRTSGVCCRELIDEERTLINPDVVRDVVIGLSDGLTVPFALTAGLSSLGESKLVVLGGIAELIAGAISMGIGGFLASQAERDHYRYLKKRTSQRVLQSCSSQMEREVADILGPVGVDEKTCRAVARCLSEVEVEVDGHGGGEEVVRSRGDGEGLWWDDKVGMTAFLLKFGEGLEEIPNRRMYTSAGTIGVSYLLGGLIPLLPYFFISRALIALIYSSMITCLTLLIFGAVKARVTGAAQKITDYLWGAFSTLMVGGLAAAAAFGIVKVLEGGAVVARN